MSDVWIVLVCRVYDSLWWSVYQYSFLVCRAFESVSCVVYQYSFWCVGLLKSVGVWCIKTIYGVWRSNSLVCDISKQFFFIFFGRFVGRLDRVWCVGYQNFTFGVPAVWIILIYDALPQCLVCLAFKLFIWLVYQTFVGVHNVLTV